MSFYINEIYGAIPCSVKYTVLDASLNTIYTRTVTTPPTSPPPPPPPACMTPNPAFVDIDACGSIMRVTLDPSGICTDFQLFCPCLPTPSWYTFHVCLIPTPGGPCDYVLEIHI
jgi:hypothetical protein